ncbi:hypothetical protein M5K25_017344 [Dendrobium thyrsiflorum]|uniref:Uncharacterized protein n=1 Tax=Dendrobium thyrsiflorum TaxID=117978 RepID=A0ABD0UTW5_DENTH
MEKLLAMSILSASPAEIAGFWGNLRLPCKKNSSECSVKEGEQITGGKQREEQKKGKAAWFAPEFDGLNCFETFVSH